jgi:hypothetical protein
MMPFHPGAERASAQEAGLGFVPAHSATASASG